MNALAPSRVGWCPGALRPMLSGDGLILRIKPRGGSLDLMQARRIADVSRRFGNGALDLTSRANLQIRGVDETGLSAALDRLDDAGLLDENEGAEAVRNVVSSPLAGFDAGAILDIRPAVSDLEARLSRDPGLHGLPAKFSFVVDDGGAWGLGDVAADVRFEAVQVHGRPAFWVGLGADATLGGPCEADALAETAAAIARLFIAARTAEPDIRHMGHLVQLAGAETLLQRAGLTLMPPRPYRSEDGAAPPVSGWIMVPEGIGVLGIAAPFGRFTAEQFQILTEAAADAGAGELRLTPWRAVLLPGVSKVAAQGAAQVCEAAGWIVDPCDPRLAVAACPGAPGCRRGSAPVLAHASRLAHLLGPIGDRRGIALHVSGCGKGCAHAGQAPITLVGHDGRYDIVFDGRASDIPALQNLSLEDVERCLGRRRPRTSS